MTPNPWEVLGPLKVSAHQRATPQKNPGTLEDRKSVQIKTLSSKKSVTDSDILIGSNSNTPNHLIKLSINNKHNRNMIPSRRIGKGHRQSVQKDN